MMKRLLQLASVLLLSSLSFAGTITGKISQANTTIPVAKGTLTFQLSQGAYLSGTFALATDTQYCYTDTLGNVVGVVDPRTAPVVNTNIVSGTLAAGTYYVVYSYKTSLSETYYSAETTINLPSIGSLIVSAPALQPASATGYNVYISSATGTETKQGTVAGWTAFTQSTALVSGSALPSVNSTTCTISFNDEMIPSMTSYRVSISNSAGTAIGGFPQKWRLFGGAAGTINVANGYPTATGDVYFQTPVLTTPPSNVRQSVNGPITFNGYDVTAGRFIGTSATASHVTVDGLNSTVTVNTANNVTETWTNPAAIRTFTHPDPGANWNYFYTPTPGAVDCTQSWIVCTLTTKVYFEAAGCNGSTSALGWDTFSTNAPSAACITGSNTQKGVLKFKAAVNLEQQQQNNLNPAAAGTITLTPLTTTVGDLLIAVVSVLGNSTITGCNDGSAYTLAKRQQNGATLGVEIWYRQNASALAGATLTCTVGVNSVMGLQFYEYSGAAAVALDTTQGGTGTGTSLATTVTSTTAQATELVFAAASVAGTGVTLTTGSGYAVHSLSANTQSTGITGLSQGSIANATGTFTGAMTIGSSAVWAEAIATFKSTTSPGPTQSAQRGYLLPSDFVAPLNVNFLWFNPIAAGTNLNVQLGVATVCTAAGSTDDAAFNTATTATAAVPGTTRALNSTAINAVTISGCAAGNLMHLQAQRVAGSTSDNYEREVEAYGFELTTARTQ